METPPHAGRELCEGTVQKSPQQPLTLTEGTRFGVPRSAQGTLCQSFSSRGSSRLSCPVPSPRALPLTTRASFLPSSLYLARMTRREAGVSPSGAGVWGRHPSFLVTTQDLVQHEQPGSPVLRSHPCIQGFRGPPG